MPCQIYSSFHLKWIVQENFVKYSLKFKLFISLCLKLLRSFWDANSKSFRFKFSTPVFPHGFNLLYYTGLRISAKYDFPLWLASGEHDWRPGAIYDLVLRKHLFSQVGHFPQEQINVNQPLQELWPLKLYLHSQISLTKCMFTVSFI